MGWGDLQMSDPQTRAIEKRGRAKRLARRDRYFTLREKQARQREIWESVPLEDLKCGIRLSTQLKWYPSQKTVTLHRPAASGHGDMVCRYWVGDLPAHLLVEANPTTIDVFVRDLKRYFEEVGL